MMSILEMQRIFNENGIVKFRLYSLDYIIERESDKVCIYTTDYPNRKKYYDSISELLSTHLIYNETIAENETRIIKI